MKAGPLSKSPRRHGKALLGAAAAAMLASSGTAAAAPPEVYYTSFSPANPRTTTPVKFSSGGYDPEETTIQYAWDLAATGAFSSLSENNFLEHTFTTDGVHWVVSRLQDGAGEKADTRFQIATHPDNWAPLGSIDDFAHQNFRTAKSEYDSQMLRVYVDHDDSPKAGHKASWDLNGDGTFNGAGDGTEVKDFPLYRRANFIVDGTHPVKVKISDGQGEELSLSGTVRTHTTNEGPFLQYQAYDETTVSVADLQAGEGYVGTSWADDYTGFSGITYSWKIDGVTQEGQTGSGMELPANLSVGEHTAEVTASDNGYLPGEWGSDSPTGEAKTTRHTIKVTVVEAYPTHAAELSAYSMIDYSHSAAPTFRTLENVRLYAYEGTGKVGTSYAWDLDNDGQFDDATGYGTYFAAPNKGTYKVGVRIEIKDGAPVTLDRTIVIDKGQDYAPAPPTNNTNNNTGNQNPPAATPEQVKAAMVTFLTNETAEFLQLVAGQNKKGIDAAKAILALGTLGPDQLPNGGTGDFKVYDKAGKKLVARAAAAKRKMLGSTKVTLVKGQSKKVQVKLNKKGKALLKKKGKVKLTVDATLTDALTGAQVTQSKSYTFKVKKKKRK